MEFLTCSRSSRFMRLVAPTPLVALQHDVRATLGGATSRPAECIDAALGLQSTPQAEASGWTPAARTQTLERIHDALMQARHIVLVGAGVAENDIEQPWEEGTVFVAADGAVGACLGRVDVVCVVTDLDGEPHLSKAVESNIPLVVHAHGDNTATWRTCLQRWSASGGVPMVLTHQCDDVYDDAFNVGGSRTVIERHVSCWRWAFLTNAFRFWATPPTGRAVVRHHQPRTKTRKTHVDGAPWTFLTRIGPGVTGHESRP